MVHVLASTQNEPFSSRKEDMRMSLVWPSPQDRTKWSSKIKAPLHLSTYLTLSTYLAIAHAGTSDQHG
jgi:hypothetical protein